MGMVIVMLYKDTPREHTRTLSFVDGTKVSSVSTTMLSIDCDVNVLEHQ